MKLEKEFFTNFRNSEFRPAFTALIAAYMQDGGMTQDKEKALNALCLQIGLQLGGREHLEEHLLDDMKELLQELGMPRNQQEMDAFLQESDLDEPSKQKALQFKQAMFGGLRDTKPSKYTEDYEGHDLFNPSREGARADDFDWEDAPQVLKGQPEVLNLSLMEWARLQRDMNEEAAKEKVPLEPNLTPAQERDLVIREQMTKPPPKIIERDQEFDELDHEQLYVLWTKRLLALPPGKHHHMWMRSNTFGPLYYDQYLYDDAEQDSYGRLWRGEDVMTTPAQVDQDLYNPWEDNLTLDGVYDKFQVEFEPGYSYLAQDDEKMLDMIDARGHDAAPPLRVPRDLTETAKDALYMLHRADPVRWHPRALASLFTIPMEVTVAYLKIKAMEHNVYRMENPPVRKYFDNVPMDMQETMRWMLEQEYDYWDLHFPDVFTEDEVKMLRYKMGFDAGEEIREVEKAFAEENGLDPEGDKETGESVREQMLYMRAQKDAFDMEPERDRFDKDEPFEPYDTVLLKEAWDEYKTYAKPRKPGHRDFDEGEDMTFASFSPKFLAESQDPDYSFISDEQAMLTQELKKKEEFRFMSKAERLDFLEREQFAQTGPIGGPHPPEPPTSRLSRNVLPPTRHNWMMVDISDRRNSGFGIAVRDKDGELRTPTAEEFHALRTREKHKNLRFTYLKYRDPGGVSVQQKYHKWKKEGEVRRLDPIFVIPHREENGEKVKLPSPLNQ